MLKCFLNHRMEQVIIVTSGLWNYWHCLQTPAKNHCETFFFFPAHLLIVFFHKRTKFPSSRRLWLLYYTALQKILTASASATPSNCRVALRSGRGRTLSATWVNTPSVPKDPHTNLFKSRIDSSFHFHLDSELWSMLPAFLWLPSPLLTLKLTALESQNIQINPFVLLEFRGAPRPLF